MKLWALDDVKARSKFWCVRRRDRERGGDEDGLMERVWDGKSFGTTGER